METLAYTLLATISVSLTSFAGILVLLTKLGQNNRVITALISFAAGTLIGDAFLHLLNEHIEEFGYQEKTIFLIFAGITIMLGIESYLHCSHDSSEDLDHQKHHILARMNLIGDGLHNFLDGVAIAASFLISPATGLATTIAVALHEIPQELADVSVLKYAGWSNKKIMGFNFLTALTAMIGAVVVLVLGEVAEGIDEYLLPFVVGQFIYIALADFVPEIHKKLGFQKYLIEIAMFVAGLLVMYALVFVE